MDFLSRVPTNSERVFLIDGINLTPNILETIIE